MVPNFQQQYNEFQQTIKTLSVKLAQLDGDLSEHKIVLDTLRSLPDERRCWRMVDTALVEMTCAEARTKLEEVIGGMAKSIKELDGTLNKQQKEFVDWQEKNHVKVVRTQG